jgi:hypothetical protein
MGPLNSVAEAAAIAVPFLAAAVSVVSVKRGIPSQRSNLRAVAWGAGGQRVVQVAATFARDACMHPALDDVVEGEVLSILPTFPSDDLLGPQHVPSGSHVSPPMVRHLHDAEFAGGRHRWPEVDPESSTVVRPGGGLWACGALS